MIKILFVCHGNICRSPMAEFMLKDMVKKLGRAGEFQIDSAATSTEEIGSDMHSGTKSILRKYNVDFCKRAARQAEKSDYDKYDYIIAMDSANIRNLKRIFGGDRDNKIYKLLDFTEFPRDVADPWYTGNFEKTYDDISVGIEAFLDKIHR